MLRKLLFMAAIAITFVSAQVMFAGSAPTLSEPANTSTCNGSKVLFKWVPPPNGNYARLIVAEDIDFSNIYFEEDSLSTTFKEITFNTWNKKYYWKVVSRFSTDPSIETSAVWNFTIKKAPTTLVSPANNAFCVSREVELEWTAMPTATVYVLQYSQFNDFPDTATVHVPVINDTKSLVSLPLDNERYFWRVKTIYGSCESDWSDVSTFRTKLPIVSLATPADKEKGFPLFASSPFNVNLKWHPSKDAVSYNVVLSDSAHFPTNLFESQAATDTSVAVNNVLTADYNKTYFWKVRALHNNDSLTNCYTDWSATYSLLTPYAAMGLVYPDDADVCVSLSSQLRWHKVRGAQAYRVQVSEATDFATLLIDRPLVTDSMTVVDLPKAMTNYYWRVRAEDSLNTGYWSNAFTFKTTNTPPKAISPVDSSACNALAQVITWEENDIESIYHLQISEKSDFSTLLVDSVNIDTNKFNYNFTKYNQKYYWRVIVAAGGCTSDWSRGYLLKTQLAAPTLVEPKDTATTVAISPFVSWNAVPAAEVYEVQYSKTADFSNPQGKLGIPNITMKLPELEENTKYFWRVRGTNAECTGLWSQAFSFTTAYILPDTVKLLTPGNATVKLPIDTVVITWKDTFRAMKYHVQVTEELAFSNTIVDTIGYAGTSFTLTDLKNYKTYRWRVRAENLGGFGPWSPTYYFRTIALPPATPPGLASPITGATDQNKEVRVTWQEVNGAEHYQVQLSKTANFTSTIEDKQPVYVLYQWFYNLEPNSEYFWRVRAINEAGVGPWAEPNTFKTKDFVSVNEELAAGYQVSVAPNPAKDRATVSFSLNNYENIKVSMFDANGVRVAELLNSYMPAGAHSVEINASSLASGVYMVVIETENGAIKQNISVVK